MKLIEHLSADKMRYFILGYMYSDTGKISYGRMIHECECLVPIQELEDFAIKKAKFYPDLVREKFCIISVSEVSGPDLEILFPPNA